MDLFISMDSANMHLASFVSTPVISVWGDPPYVSTDSASHRSMQCRLPLNADLLCLGNKKCYLGDYACLNEIEPSDLIKKVEDFSRQKIISRANDF